MKFIVIKLATERSMCPQNTNYITPNNLKNHIQAYGHSVGHIGHSVPDHHNKANITIN